MTAVTYLELPMPAFAVGTVRAAGTPVDIQPALTI